RVLLRRPEKERVVDQEVARLERVDGDGAPCEAGAGRAPADLRLLAARLARQVEMEHRRAELIGRDGEGARVVGPRAALGEDADCLARAEPAELELLREHRDEVDG